MNKKTTTIITIVLALIAIAALWYVAFPQQPEDQPQTDATNQNMEDAMMKEGDSMMEDDNAMEEKEDSMVEAELYTSTNLGFSLNKPQRTLATEYTNFVRFSVLAEGHAEGSEINDGYFFDVAVKPLEQGQNAKTFAEQFSESGTLLKPVTQTSINGHLAYTFVFEGIGNGNITYVIVPALDGTSVYELSTFSNDPEGLGYKDDIATMLNSFELATK